MGRLLTWPDKVGVTSVEFTDGPMTRTSGRSTALDGTEQTFEGVGGVVAFSVELAATRGQEARYERGLLLALRTGANAARMRLIDGDRRTRTEAKVSARDRVTWAKGVRWHGGVRWRTGYPEGVVNGQHSKGQGLVNLRNDAWGRDLTLGEAIGFSPLHFGAYFVTEVMGGGWVRVWPPLRKGLKGGDRVTLEPVLVMRATPGAFAFARGPVTTNAARVELVEMLDEHVRTFFAGDMRVVR